MPSSLDFYKIIFLHVIHARSSIGKDKSQDEFKSFYMHVLKTLENL